MSIKVSWSHSLEWWTAESWDFLVSVAVGCAKKFALQQKGWRKLVLDKIRKQMAVRLKAQLTTESRFHLTQAKVSRNVWTVPV